MNLAPTTSGQVDPLETTADLFVAAAQPFGVARPRAIEAYRTFYRTGQLSEDWIAAPNRTLGETLVEGSTRKFTLDVPRTKGMQTESVLIPMDRRDGTTTSTLCVSSQVGCAMGCTFCETAQMGLQHNLSIADIVAQWYVATYVLSTRPKNIVFMGMGEPTDNLDAVIPAIQILTDHDGAAMATSNISVSTVGNPAGIRRLGELAAKPGFRRLNLAVSINAPNNDIRAEIMPTARGWSMAELMEVMLEWPGRPRAAICIEYVLIPGVNDSPAHCDEVCEYLKPLHCSLNVIPYNPRRDSPWPAPEETAVGTFVKRAIANGQFTKRRGTKGRDVMAACGQLGNPELRKKRQHSS